MPYPFKKWPMFFAFVGIGMILWPGPDWFGALGLAVSSFASGYGMRDAGGFVLFNAQLRRFMRLPGAKP